MASWTAMRAATSNEKDYEITDAKTSKRLKLVTTRHLETTLNRYELIGRAIKTFAYYECCQSRSICKCNKI